MNSLRPWLALWMLLGAFIPAEALASNDHLAGSGIHYRLSTFEPNVGDDTARSYHNANLTETSMFHSVSLISYANSQFVINPEYGQLGLALSVGQWKADNGSDASLSVIPLSLGVIFRSDYLKRHWSVPLIAYAEAGLDTYLWDGEGPFRLKDEGKDSSHSASDASSGMHTTIGIGLDLDGVLSLGKEGSGPKTSYTSASLVIELHKTWLNNFESDANESRFDMTATHWQFGLAIDI